ncbi:hypothetical protein B0H14DRAFT_670331 [Mycena olivaceomarginata]|nr:hypothetical protein B0H14DRAFT_670331 [Mycena olivaceomarginata]
MGRKKRSQLDAAARARQGRYPTSVTIEYSPRDPRYAEETEWTGGVNHCLSDTDLWETESSGLEPDTDLAPENSPSSDEASDLDHDLELLDMDDAAVVDRITQEQSRQAELWRLSSLKMDLTRKEWKKVEANRSLGYNGQSRASQYRHAKHAREKAAVSAEAAKTPQAKGFASFFQRPSPANLSSHTPSAATSTTPANPSPPLHPLMSATPGTTSPPSVPTSPPVPMYPVPRVNDTGFHAPVYGYLSDVESSESDSDSGDEGGDESETRAQPVRNKRRKLDVPVREQVRLKKEKRAKDRHDALTAVEKVISLKRTEYQGPLQAKRAQVIQSTLHLVVRNSRSLMEASAMAAETHGFAAIWGSRLARKMDCRVGETSRAPRV